MNNDYPGAIKTMDNSGGRAYPGRGPGAILWPGDTSGLPSTYDTCHVSISDKEGPIGKEGRREEAWLGPPCITKAQAESDDQIDLPAEPCLTSLTYSNILLPSCGEPEETTPGPRSETKSCIAARSVTGKAVL